MDFAKMWFKMRIALNNKNSWGKNELKGLMESIEAEELEGMITKSPIINISAETSEVDIEKLAEEIGDKVFRLGGNL